MKQRSKKHYSGASKRLNPTRRITRQRELYIAEVPLGANQLAKREVKKLTDKSLRFVDSHREDEIAFELDGDITRLKSATVLNAVYKIISFDITRPRGILEGQNLKKLTEEIKKITDNEKKRSFLSFRLSAAGKESADFQRIQERLSTACGLPYNDDEGDLHLRFRPATVTKNGWEILIRTTPRPLTLRRWRTAHYPGALEGTIARLMIYVSQSGPTDVVFNPMCGSGTLLIERLLSGASGRLIGCDTNYAALECARINTSQLGEKNSIELFSWDACSTPLEARSVSSILCDLPWGERVGEKAKLEKLYSNFLIEMRRMVKDDGRMVLITQATKQLLAAIESSKKWELLHSFKTSQGGFSPWIFLLLPS